MALTQFWVQADATSLNLNGAKTHMLELYLTRVGGCTWKNHMGRNLSPSGSFDPLNPLKPEVSSHPPVRTRCSLLSQRRREEEGKG